MSPSLDRTRASAAGDRDILGWLCRWLPPLLCMAGIFCLSAQPDLPHAPDPFLDVLLKKAGHIAEYVILFLLFFRAWRHGRDTGPALQASLWATAAYALSDELHQALVPGRHANWYDVLIDVSGILVLWRFLSTRRFPAILRAQDDDLSE